MYSEVTDYVHIVCIPVASSKLLFAVIVLWESSTFEY